MSNTILQALLKSREGSVTVGDLTFLFRRPTDYEALKLNRGEYTQFDICRDFVNGWKGMTEHLILRNKCFDPVEFEPVLYSEWLADNPKYWASVSNAVLDAYKVHIESIKDSVKN